MYSMYMYVIKMHINDVFCGTNMIVYTVVNVTNCVYMCILFVCLFVTLLGNARDLENWSIREVKKDGEK